MKNDDAAYEDFVVCAVTEAISFLGLVKAEALSDLVAALPHYMADPSYARSLHKQGSPLTATERTELGISSRALVSQELLAQLTPDGIREAPSAHALTLQRASHSVARYKNLNEAKRAISLLDCSRVCPDTTDCPQVDAWEKLDAVDPLPPKECRDKDYRTCRSTFVFQLEE